jgi:simple sugar transport system ATP-binding protein
VLRDVGFTVNRGEIVAIAGVEGNGQAELEEVLYGLRTPVRGELRLNGKDLTTAAPVERMRCGLGLVPSDRYRRGLIAELAIAENMVYDRIDRPPFGSTFAIQRKAILDTASELARRFSIQVPQLTRPVSTLSGGNAQRVVLARILGQELCCLIAAQPTRGLDVGAVRHVWDQLDAARARGTAILLISTDLDEVLALADRCFVLYRGRLAETGANGVLDRKEIGLAMGGAGLIRVPAGGLQA